MEMAQRRAHREQLRVTFSSNLTWLWHSLTVRKGRHNMKFAALNPRLSQRPCLLKSAPTPTFGNRFTTTCGCNIPNGSKQMASRLCVISTRHASWNSYSDVKGIN
jgi:hypothetical protein